MGALSPTCRFVAPGKAAGRSMRSPCVTTASPLRPPAMSTAAASAKQAWSGLRRRSAGALFTDNVAWDKESTHTRDRESFLPDRGRAACSRARAVFAGLAGALPRRANGVQPAQDARRGCAAGPVAPARRRGRRRDPLSALTRLSPDRESGRPYTSKPPACRRSSSARRATSSNTAACRASSSPTSRWAIPAARRTAATSSALPWSSGART